MDEFLDRLEWIREMREETSVANSADPLDFHLHNVEKMMMRAERDKHRRLPPR